MSNQTKAPQEATFETIITNALASLDVGAPAVPAPLDYRAAHEARLAALAAEVAALPDIVDAKTYEANQKARTRLVGIRTGIDKTRKALFAPVRALKEQVDAYLGTGADSGLQARLKALEAQIEARQAVWDAERERLRQEAQRKVEERNQQRAAMLVDMGMAFDGVSYHLPGVRYASRDVFGWTDEVFDRAVEMAKPIATAERDRIHAERIAAEAERERREREAAEEQERLRLEFERQAAERARMDAERAEINRQRAAMREEMRHLRRTALLNIGLYVTPLPDGLDKVEYSPEDFDGDIYDLASLSDSEWREALEVIKERAVIREKERELREDVAHARAACLTAIGAQHGADGMITLGARGVLLQSLMTAEESEWEKVLGDFKAEAEAIMKLAEDPHRESEDTDVMRIEHVPTDELLACALALLDEANKAIAVLGGDDRMGLLVQIQSHAGSCVELAREIQD